jgi:hypothetical protein
MSKPPSLLKAEHYVWQLVWALSENPGMDLKQEIKSTVKMISPITLQASKEELDWFTIRKLHLSFYL